MILKRRKKRLLQKKKRNALSIKMDTIRHKVEVFSCDGMIYVHLKKQIGIWNLKQCIVFVAGSKWYDGVEIEELDKKWMELEDLSTEQQKYLLEELE